MSEIKLKPCPFCGGEAVLHVGDGVCAICIKCGCRTTSLVDGSYSGKPSGSAIKSVAEKWNTRKPMERIVEQLEDLRDKAEYDVKHGKGILIKEPFTPYNKAIEIVKKGGAE